MVLEFVIWTNLPNQNHHSYQNWIADRREAHDEVVCVMTNQELIGDTHMEWIRKHMQNKDNTGEVKTQSNDQKLFQAKVDRQLADDFGVVSIALGQSQKKLLAEDDKVRA